MNHHLIKHGRNEFIDLANGRKYKEYNEKPYSKCNHGLCDKLGTCILKRVIKSKNNPNLFVAISEKSPEFKPIIIQFLDIYKKKVKWTFDSSCINECIKGMDEELTDRQIAIRLGCVKELIPILKKKIEIQCLGAENGRTNEPADTARNRVGNIKGISGISGH